MSNIQIKRYNGTTTTWESLFPNTKAQNILNNAGTESVFDANNKLKTAYLPDAIFDSLEFFSVVGQNSDLRNLVVDAYEATRPLYTTEPRNIKGLYWVASANITLTAPAGSISYNDPFSPLDPTFVVAILLPSEEGKTTDNTSVTIETGDWVVITKVTGDGSNNNPFAVTFAVVNNTYELAGTSNTGIVTLSSQTVWANLAGNNVVTDARLKALADGQFQPQLNTLADRVQVFYDGTPSGMVTDDLWFDAV